MTPDKQQDVWLWADWPAPQNIRAGTSIRNGGFSQLSFNELNLAQHVGDDVNNVDQNRRTIIQYLGLKSEPVWLNQTHSKDIISIDEFRQNLDADGVIATKPNRICTIMTADCAPVLFCDQSGTTIAAIHAGWKGICNGIIENAVSHFPDPSNLLAWIGPCISKQYYEVGNDVYSACLAHSNLLNQAFEPKDNDKWYCDLGCLVKIILKNTRIGAIYECDLCTYKREDLFYSYRRDGVTGRTASMIWMEYAQDT